MTNIYIFSSVIIVSLISLIGVIALVVQIERLKKILMFLVSFSAGSLIGGAFMHLLPELIEEKKFTLNSSLLIISGILLFFILEKFLHWRHCHIPTCKEHPHHLAMINLVGDGMHNLLDGVIIAASFFINPTTGIATTIAVALHEIPQEIGDFGVLIYAGLSKLKAIAYNLISALTAILGAGIAIVFQNYTEGFTEIAVPLTIGGFIYIATADLIPELKKEDSLLSSLKQFIGIVLGIGVMALLLLNE
ncbi:ZIP family metal transporter [Candidatus Falkowbacteria bacterium CG10_big_fil_rev_8_21_14_0_10_43_10]|uniref:ZIP family metal transporter n=1 Tax=Candidatus Falkowbacteria bacterium CG10_big_fil_rev_8_21_14_0_10_43_10 TaxID=1974567 RepID=A0A2H0V328_9BACT|nr:MAG: ZIP family metal transporter [Candidatus Falkowbacteria bacterium CG10_big_fil_rev_8_21_14_0_10_43_10]